MATIHVYGTLDEAIPSVKHQLECLAVHSSVDIEINARGGTIGALFTVWKLFQTAKREKNLTYTVTAIRVKSAALMLFICFPIEERVVTKKSTALIHLPSATYEGSDVREQAIKFIAEKTALTATQVIYYEQVPLGAQKMIRLGIAQMQKRERFVPTE